MSKYSSREIERLKLNVWRPARGINVSLITPNPNLWKMSIKRTESKGEKRGREMYREKRDEGW